MYIRTSCGVLGILKHIKLNMYEFNNERYIKNGIRLHNSNHDYTIKSQGDNLIDVLEVDDMILDKRLTIFLRLDKFITSTYNDFVQLDIGTGGYIIEENISKVITHEQYLPLAQEVL